jgi:HD-GYP domain-containing protein (c-di-GMP phosphodiesterase class II)
MSYYAQLIARGIAPVIGRDDDWVEYVGLFAPLHDIGKITTPDAILFKPGKLTESEFEVMKQHAPKGASILLSLIDSLSLEQVPHIESLIQIARHHHERWDGAGYPDGLAGEAIPPEACIIKVADVFDALTSKRCYKEPWPVEKAAEYLREGAGSQFDPRCVDILLAQNEHILEVMTRFSGESTEAAS